MAPCLNKATELISGVVGKALPVFVDWNTYIKADDFLIRPDQLQVCFPDRFEFVSYV